MDYCRKCKIEFPNKFINEVVTRRRRYIVCPLCALRIFNVSRRWPLDRPFDNPVQRKLYLEAVQYLRTKRGYIHEKAGDLTRIAKGTYKKSKGGLWLR